MCEFLRKMAARFPEIPKRVLKYVLDQQQAHWWNDKTIIANSVIVAWGLQITDLFATDKSRFLPEKSTEGQEPKVNVNDTKAILGNAFWLIVCALSCRCRFKLSTYYQSTACIICLQMYSFMLSTREYVSRGSCCWRIYPLWKACTKISFYGARCRSSMRL